MPTIPLCLLNLMTFRADIHCGTKKKKTVLLVDVVVGRMVELTPDQNPHGAGPGYDVVRSADFVGHLQCLNPFFRSILLDTIPLGNELNMTSWSLTIKTQ